MGVTETLRILLTIFLSTACIQNVRVFGVYDVRWPLLAEIHIAPLKRFVPSSVLQAVRALRNATAASAVFLAGVAPVDNSIICLILPTFAILIHSIGTSIYLSIAMAPCSTPTVLSSASWPPAVFKWEHPKHLGSYSFVKTTILQ